MTKLLCSSVEIMTARVILSANRFKEEHILFAYPTNFTTSIEKKNYIGYLESRLKTCNNVKFYEMLPSALLLPASKIKVQTINSTIFNRRIEAIVLEVIKFRKLKHVLPSNKHEEF